jgi:hypothetical protein
MLALDGAAQVSKAEPEKVPGWTVGAADAVRVASARESGVVDSSTIATQSTAGDFRMATLFRKKCLNNVQVRQ